MGAGQSAISKSPFKDAANKFDANTIRDLRADWTANVGHALSEATFAQFCKMLPDLKAEECQPLFYVYDVNKNGTILWSEFVAVKALITKGTLDEKVQLMFHAFDTNANGKISKKEFGLGVTHFSGKKNDDFVEKTFEACDTDKNGWISYDEFANWVKTDPDTYKTVCSKLNIDLEQ